MTNDDHDHGPVLIEDDRDEQEVPRQPPAALPVASDSNTSPARPPFKKRFHSGGAERKDYEKRPFRKDKRLELLGDTDEATVTRLMTLVSSGKLELLEKIEKDEIEAALRFKQAAEKHAARRRAVAIGIFKLIVWAIDRLMVVFLSVLGSVIMVNYLMTDTPIWRTLEALTPPIG